MEVLLSLLRGWEYRPVRPQRGSRLPLLVKARLFKGLSLSLPGPLRGPYGGAADCELDPYAHAHLHPQALPEVVVTSTQLRAQLLLQLLVLLLAAPHLCVVDHLDALHCQPPVHHLRQLVDGLGGGGGAHNMLYVFIGHHAFLTLLYTKVCDRHTTCVVCLLVHITQHPTTQQ